MKNTSIWKSILRRLFGSEEKTISIAIETSERQSAQKYGIPTVPFDKALVTAPIKANIKESVLKIPDISPQHIKQAYKVSLESVEMGRDAFTLSIWLNENCGISVHRSGDIAVFINNRATAMITKERQQTLGITRAKWMYSNSPCAPVLKLENVDAAQMDDAHKAANGKAYFVSKGMLVNGKWTWPGYEDGCKCGSRSVIPGISE